MIRRRIGELFVCEESGRAFWRGVMVDLQRAQYETLLCLTNRPDAIRTRETILNYRFPDADLSPDTDRSVDTQIRQLRRRFKAVDPTFNQIATRSGYGYTWRLKT